MTRPTSRPTRGTLETDAAYCERLGVACIFAPGVDTMYPPGEMDRPAPLPPVATGPGLEDRFRPGHFEGVYRICRRLFEVSRCATPTSARRTGSRSSSCGPSWSRRGCR